MHRLLAVGSIFGIPEFRVSSSADGCGSNGWFEGMQLKSFREDPVSADTLMGIEVRL